MNLDFIIDNKEWTLEYLGITPEYHKDLNIHIIFPDPRYPLLCVNGVLNFGVDINPETGEISKERGCICGSRSDESCICDL